MISLSHSEKKVQLFLCECAVWNRAVLLQVFVVVNEFITYRICYIIVIFENKFHATLVSIKNDQGQAKPKKNLTTQENPIAWKLVFKHNCVNLSRTVIQQ